jgi:hypothetical protein
MADKMWKAASKEAAVIADEGDILNPLRRVALLHIVRARKLDESAYGDNRAKIKATALWHRQAAANVQALMV